MTLSRFDKDKALQAIAVILRAHRLDFASKLRILKLLYIAERECLRDTGRPILGSRIVAMDHGPLHSAVKYLIEGQTSAEPEFSTHFDKFGYMVQLSDDPGVHKLSQIEIEKLQEVCERYLGINDWVLAHYITHGFEEWKAVYREGTSTTIPLETLLDAVGRENDKQDIMGDLRRSHEADHLFGGPSDI